MSTVISPIARQIILNRPATSAPARLRPEIGDNFRRSFPSPTSLSSWRRRVLEAASHWQAVLPHATFRSFVRAHEFERIAAEALRVESAADLLLPAERSTLRDAVRQEPGARAFAVGLYDFLHGPCSLRHRFNRWCDAIHDLPRRVMRVSAWPVLTVFGFLADPMQHILVKPATIRQAARNCGFALRYTPQPSWEMYASVLEFTETLRQDPSDLRPRDMIDIQAVLIGKT